MNGCNDGSSSKDSSSSIIEGTPIIIFEETFDKEGMWELSTDISTTPDSDDWASAEIQNGALTLEASQEYGCVNATASLMDNLTVSSDTIEIEMYFNYVTFSAMGDLSFELTINKIKIVFDLNFLNPATDDHLPARIIISHINGNTYLLFDGMEAPESFYTVENVEWDGFEIVFKSRACGADAWASAMLKVDYIGILAYLEN
jgi:hypothetical protein